MQEEKQPDSGGLEPPDRKNNLMNSKKTCQKQNNLKSIKEVKENQVDVSTVTDKTQQRKVFVKISEISENAQKNMDKRDTKINLEHIKRLTFMKKKTPQADEEYIEDVEMFLKVPSCQKRVKNTTNF